MGVAAPQLGIDRAVAIVRTADAETITLLNPRVIEESAETDEQYEGCWSFFDVRGMVPRPRAITVEHQEIDGQRRITIFENAVVRLVAHEIDHLEGVLYTARMRPGVEPVPRLRVPGDRSGVELWGWSCRAVAVAQGASLRSADGVGGAHGEGTSGRDRRSPARIPGSLQYQT
ncbi:peptide deformylase [Kitasatospora sp. NPDC007106]|uniref:peptide deformylase n=1 Tax=Kitasatospora sp. NPDC007106 TaxID=3156914 RepID=UPI0033DF73C9